MYAVRRPIDNVYLVRERDRRRTRELLALSLAALPPMAVLFAAIWANLETVRLGYQLERVEKQREVLLERNRQLRVEKAQATALARVESIAKGRLGMVPPRPAQVILVEDGVLGSVRRKAAPGAKGPELIGPPAPISTEEGF